MPRLILAAVALLCGVAPLGAAEPQLAHMVFFTLEEDSDASREALVAACQKYLSGHEGTVYFSVGTLADDLQREVNDRDFHVALHLVFANKAAHDKYQTSPRHLKFIEENKDRWSRVRVFDSYVVPPSHDPLPSAARGFAGMLRGEVVARQTGGFVLHVEEVAKVWRTNKAEDPKSLAGRKVLVRAREDARLIARFVESVKPGDAVSIDVANREGDSLTILELTRDQRERLAR